MIWNRKQNSLSAEQEFIKLCLANNCKCVNIGIETNTTEQIKEILRLSKQGDKIANDIRYNPDFEISMDYKKCLIEIKSSQKCIEKHSYDRMMELENAGVNCRILFWIDTGNKYKACRPSDLHFIHGSICNVKNISYCDSYWRTPTVFSDTWTEEMYNQWRKDYPHLSGTNFALIDWFKTDYTEINF